MQPVTVLSIAGSDSGGGAGIQADLRTFAALGAHGTTAITASTAQNTLGVADIHAVPVNHLRAQLRAVLDDFDVAAVKTGMLASPELIAVVAEFASSGLLPSLVVDPVFTSTSQHQLISDGGVDAYRTLLLPHSYLITPNLIEASMLVGCRESDIATIDDMISVGTTLQSFGVANVLIKGGHLVDEQAAPDVLVGDDGVHVFSSERIRTTNDHGTGCTLSAAICVNVALGRPISESCRLAKDFVNAALNGGARWQLGRGRGPIDHLGWSR